MTKEGRNLRGDQSNNRLVTASLVLRKPQHSDVCILGVSMSAKSDPSQEPFYGENWKAILEAVRENGVKECVIVIGDTLYRYNFERQGFSGPEAYIQAKKLGEDWKTVKRKLPGSELPVSNEDLIKQILEEHGIKVTIRHWDDYIQQPFSSLEAASSAAASSSEPASSSIFSSYSRFNEMLALVERVDDPKVHMKFHGRLTKVVKEVLDPTPQGKPVLLPSKKALNLNSEEALSVRRYIKEEIAVIAVWEQEYPNAIFPYPTKKAGKVMQRIRKCFKTFVHSLDQTARSQAKLCLLDIAIKEPHNPPKKERARSQQQKGLLLDVSTPSVTISPLTSVDNMRSAEQQDNNSTNLIGNDEKWNLPSVSAPLDIQLEAHRDDSPVSPVSSDEELSPSCSPPDGNLPVLNKQPSLSTNSNTLLHRCRSQEDPASSASASSSDTTTNLSKSDGGVTSASKVDGVAIENALLSSLSSISQLAELDSHKALLSFEIFMRIQVRLHSQQESQKKELASTVVDSQLLRQINAP